MNILINVQAFCNIYIYSVCFTETHHSDIEMKLKFFVKSHVKQSVSTVLCYRLYILHE